MGRTFHFFIDFKMLLLYNLLGNMEDNYGALYKTDITS